MDFRRKITSPKIGKIRWQITLADNDAAIPIQFTMSRCKKDNSITHAAMAPSNLDAAMTMRFATSGCKPASLDANGNTKRQQSCSGYTAICNQRFKKRIESRTHEQPLVAEHRGETDRARFERSRTRRTHEVPFTAGRSHFTRKKHKVSCPGFLPKRSQCNIHAAINNAFSFIEYSLTVSRFKKCYEVTRHTTNCSVMWSHRPTFIEYSLTLLIVMWCKVTHHPSVSIVTHHQLFRDVKSHTTLHWI